MRKYETVIIWSASLSEPELENELSRVKEIVSAENGTFRKLDSWGKRQLSYAIKKHTEGIYHFLRWDGDDLVTAGIDKYLRINDNCIRYLTLRADDSVDIDVPSPSPRIVTDVVDPVPTVETEVVEEVIDPVPTVITEVVEEVAEPVTEPEEKPPVESDGE